jgi:hypothetical protein
MCRRGERVAEEKESGCARQENYRMPASDGQSDFEIEIVTGS